MNPTLANNQRVRVANFSQFDLANEHQLAFDAQDPDSILRKIRTHADLPYVYVVGEEQAAQIPALLSALKAVRSPCYPYALFSVGGADLKGVDSAVDIIEIEHADPETIQQQVNDYAATRLQFDRSRLRIGSTGDLPQQTQVTIIGAGITGLFAASKLREAGIDFCVVDKSQMVGGIWSNYANTTSQVNTSECAYRLFEKETRSNRDHSFTREVLEDLAQLSGEVSEQLFLETEVVGIEKADSGYRVAYRRQGESRVLESTGVILAINDRVGPPRQVAYENQAAFGGEIVTGISDNAQGVEWRDKNVVIVGMGAFAVENARTALEAGARHVTVVCRRHGTICPKIIDYLNFATPYDDDFKHPKKSNMLNMMYWKKLYGLSGATEPECWMGEIKHDGHTISVSDIWFIAHHLKKLETRTGVITRMTETGVIIDGQPEIPADVVVSCIGFESNSPVAKNLSGYSETYNNNYVDENFMYLADAYIDSGAFNSLFGSSVLEMTKFYIHLFIKYFDNPAYDSMMRTEGIEKISIHERKWSHYIRAAMSLISKYPEIRAAAWEMVSQRTDNFLEFHELESYIADNKREWIDTHSQLAGRPMTEQECLPYVFEKLAQRNR